MSIKDGQADLSYVLQRGGELLRSTVRALAVDGEMSSFLAREARKEETQGLGTEPPIRMFHSGSHGSLVLCGFVSYSVQVGDSRVPLLRVHNPFTDDFCGPLNDLWIVSTDEYQRLYRWLRRGVKEKVREVAPIMDPADKQALWDNTIGFLQRGEEALEKFGVPLKRGVLLLGEPGNGKTMAARWLYTEALKNGLDWRTVTAESYDAARSHGSAHDLFQLEQPGIVLFDDFDTSLRDREDFGPDRDQSTFLSELDGIRIRRGVVYLFTSNAKLQHLDPAFKRPGRIDRIIYFQKPPADQRKRLIVEHWPAEIVAGIPVDEVVAATDGCCFAEVEEIKKLFVMRYLDTRAWDWEWALQSFKERAKDTSPDRSIGFRSNLPQHSNGHPLSRTQTKPDFLTANGHDGDSGIPF